MEAFFLFLCLCIFILLLCSHASISELLSLNLSKKQTKCAAEEELKQSSEMVTYVVKEILFWGKLPGKGK